ncbi:hypothetical protein QQF64_023716 [Cirrhinus molitorella]|uniref:Uncharacterized protein n=1 Tax=Cirrhinus molitorella TaxID=172907 RepID=A0ABR3NK27_9TELE
MIRLLLRCSVRAAKGFSGGGALHLINSIQVSLETGLPQKGCVSKNGFARFSPRCTTVALELRHVKSLESSGGAKPWRRPHEKDAVTRIRTGVAAATTQSTNHYTITARHSAGPARETSGVLEYTGSLACLPKDRKFKCTSQALGGRSSNSTSHIASALGLPVAI